MLDKGKDEILIQIVLFPDQIFPAFIDPHFNGIHLCTRIDDIQLGQAVMPPDGETKN